MQLPQNIYCTVHYCYFEFYQGYIYVNYTILNVLTVSLVNMCSILKMLLVEPREYITVNYSEVQYIIVTACNLCPLYCIGLYFII